MTRIFAGLLLISLSGPASAAPEPPLRYRGLEKMLRHFAKAGQRAKARRLGDVTVLRPVAMR
jgi:hypothetical protein